MQPVGVDQAGADQLQVGRHPGRRVGQDRQDGPLTPVAEYGGDPRSGRPTTEPEPGSGFGARSGPKLGTRTKSGTTSEPGSGIEPGTGSGTEFENQSVSSPEPHENGPVGPGAPLGAEQDPGLLGPPVDGTAAALRYGKPVAGQGVTPASRPGPQVGRPARVPQVAVQVQPEPCGWDEDADARDRGGTRPTARG